MTKVFHTKGCAVGRSGGKDKARWLAHISEPQDGTALTGMRSTSAQACASLSPKG